MEKQSILSYMVDHLEDGNLPDDFSLPREEESNGLQFADGAMDGMCIYHMGDAVIKEEDMNKIGSAVNTAAGGNTKTAEKMFEELGKKHRIINIINDLQGYIIKHAKELNAGNLYQFACRLAFESDDKECVKAGLVMLELFNLPEKAKENVRILGLSDEFTIFSLFIMQKWDNGNMELMELGKKVHGWGRIHIIDFIEPENLEIKEWILMDGVNNGVMGAYSALKCYQKAEVADILKQVDMSYEYFHAICYIVEALLDEGPVEGISQVENAEQMLVVLLNHAVRLMPLSVEDYEIIKRISDWQEEYCDDDNPEMDNLTAQIFCDDRCRQQISDEVKNGHFIRLAKELGIPYQEEVYQSMKRDFYDLSFNCIYLMKSDEYRGKTVELFTRELHLEEMKEGPTKDCNLGSANKKYMALSSIMQELGDYPKLGIELVEAGIQSPSVPNRNGAIRVMQEWVSAEKVSIEQLAPSLYQCLKNTIDLEVDEKIKDKMKELVAGKTEFDIQK